jgi:hypothetical protein
VDGGHRCGVPSINSVWVQRTVILVIVSKVFPFPLPLFLQALGYLGINDKCIMDMLWQVVSLGTVKEFRKGGNRV